MGFFEKLTGPEEPNTSQEYLQRAPSAPSGGPVVRKSLIGGACLVRISGLEVAQSAAYGRPVADTVELGPATGVVREALAQDRSLARWIARDACVLLDVVTENMMMPLPDCIAVVMESIGLTGDAMRGAPEMAPSWRAQLSTADCEQATGLASASLQIFWVVCQRALDADRTFYAHLFSSSADATQEVAYDIAAWAFVVISRLTATGRTPEVGLVDPSRREFPAMTTPGWYPNPYNHGTFAQGDVTFQRMWDGDDWTPRVRVKDGRRWVESERPMLSVPDN
jgi:hypothetical protein